MVPGQPQPQSPRARSPKPAFKRRTHACSHCQNKKSRCDRRTFGTACTNCLLDGVECVPGKSKPHRSERRRTVKPKALPTDLFSPLASDGSPTVTQPELPAFIKPLPASLSPDDLEYLSLKGVFNIPNAACRHEILRSYFLFVYPLLPLLNAECFLIPILEDHHGENVSLLLFYAVMCAGAGHVDARTLRESGFESRKAARSAFFGRARLLYDFDCEPDKVCMIQAFLLMTYWYGGREAHKDRTFWLRTAVTLAQDLGLDFTLGSCKTKRERMLKRLWWCCFMRDQFVALMIWTPPQLGARHRYLPMLELEDFELEPLKSTAFNGLQDWDFIRSRESRTSLAALCIAKAQLCVCINQILQARYSNLRYESNDQKTTMLVPQRTTANAFEIFELDRELREWYYSLSHLGNFDLRDPVDSVFARATDIVAVQRAQLKLLFLSTLLALHRPQALDAPCALPMEYQQLSKAKLHDAAEEIAHVAISMKNLGMGTHLSPRGLNLLLPILLAHLQDVTPVVDLRLRNGLEKYHDSMQTLDTIGEQGGSEAFLPSRLELAFLKFNILPAYEHKIPRSINLQASGQKMLFLEQARTVPSLSLLGTMTAAEVEMLDGLDVRRPHSSAVEAGELRTQDSSASTSSEVVPGIRKTTSPVKSTTFTIQANDRNCVIPVTHSSIADDPTDEDAILEDFFAWRLQRTKLPVQRKIVENAHQFVLVQMWTVEDLKGMADVGSDIYRLAVSGGIPDGLARSFRRELALFMSQR